MTVPNSYRRGGRTGGGMGGGDGGRAFQLDKVKLSGDNYTDNIYYSDLSLSLTFIEVLLREFSIAFGKNGHYVAQGTHTG